MNQSSRGSILVLILVFGSITLMGIGAVVSLLILEQRTSQSTVNSEQAFQVAEAGVNYYRWVLAHNPTDYNGVDKDYTDGNGTTIGHFTVTITPPTSGSSIITITSTGWSTQAPQLKRTVQARYGKPSYAEFAFLTNTNVWFGEDEEVHGRLHSNGGVRMDGDADSLVTTIKETYICGQEHGCDDEVKPGIWGTGEDPALWEFPVADAIDFDAITIDLEEMQTAAQSDGVFLADSGVFGYHVVFNGTGTFTVYKVTALKKDVKGFNGTTWVTESNDIKTESVLSGYNDHALPNNGIIFIDDQTWVSGEVNGRVTLAAAHLPEGSGSSYDIIIPNNISYKDGHDSGSVLGLIAQQDILVPLYSPTSMEITAALMAQNGHVFRYYYSNSSYPGDAIKTYIETYGTIITNDVWTWTWVNSSGTVTSGYSNTETIYDPNLIFSPPPYFPTKDEYTFISWEEIPTN